MALTGADRRKLLTEVREGLADAVGEVLAEHRFRFTRRDDTFRREQDGVQAALRLGVSSRPPSLGGVGILVQPTMTVVVPAWRDEAARLLAGASGRLLEWENPAELLICEALDWQMPGEGRFWTLPDEPTSSDVAAVGRALREAVQTWGVPFLDRVSSKDRLLEIAAGIEMPVVVHDARFTVACGAVAAGRPDLARLIIEPYGTARRESVARVLGLTP